MKSSLFPLYPSERSLWLIIAIMGRCIQHRPIQITKQLFPNKATLALQFFDVFISWNTLRCLTVRGIADVKISKSEGLDLISGPKSGGGLNILIWRSRGIGGFFKLPSQNELP